MNKWFYAIAVGMVIVWLVTLVIIMKSDLPWWMKFLLLR